MATINVLYLGDVVQGLCQLMARNGLFEYSKVIQLGIVLPLIELSREEVGSLLRPRVQECIYQPGLLAFMQGAQRLHEGLAETTVCGQLLNDRVCAHQMKGVESLAQFSGLGCATDHW